MVSRKGFIFTYKKKNTGIHDVRLQNQGVPLLTERFTSNSGNQNASALELSPNISSKKAPLVLPSTGKKASGRV